MFKNCERDVCMRAETRVVKCSDMNAICDLNKRPISEKDCNRPNGDFKCGIWVTSSWSNCTSDCFEGVRFRNVTCSDGEMCSVLTKPNSQEACQNENCNQIERGDDLFEDQFDMNVTASYDLEVDPDRNFSSTRNKRSFDEDYQVYNTTEIYDETNQTLSIQQTGSVYFKWTIGNFGQVNYFKNHLRILKFCANVKPNKSKQI